MKIVDNEKYLQLKKEEINNCHFNINDYCLSCALTITDEIRKLSYKNVTIVYGRGEIGDIGVIVANLLSNYGLEVHSVAPERDSLFALDTKVTESTNLREIRNIIRNSELIIDCLFDSALMSAVSYPYDSIINWINESDAYVVSIDIPSGISSKDGSVLGTAVFADDTLFFDYEKLGHVLFEGKTHCGKLKMLQSIFSLDALNRLPVLAQQYDDTEIKTLIKRIYPDHSIRKPEKIILFCGNKQVGDNQSEKVIEKLGPVFIKVYRENENGLRERLKHEELSQFKLGVLLSGCSLDIIRTAMHYLARYSMPMIINGEYLPYVINQETIIDRFPIIIAVIDEEQYNLMFDKTNCTVVENLQKISAKYSNMILILRSKETMKIYSNAIVIDSCGKQINESADSENILCGAIAGGFIQTEAFESVIAMEYIFSLANMLWCEKRAYCQKVARDISDLIAIVFETLKR